MTLLPRPASAPITLAAQANLRANESGVLTAAQRRQVDAWHRRAAGQLLSSAPVIGLLILVVVLGSAVRDLVATLLAGNHAVAWTFVLAVGAATYVGWLVRQQAWGGSQEDLEQGEVVARTGRLGWDRTGFRAHIDGQAWPTVGQHGLPLPVWLPTASDAPPAAALVGLPCTLYCLPRSGIVVLARPLAESTDLAAADRALTEVMARAFGLVESDLAANRLGRLSSRQRRRAQLRALPPVAAGATMVAASVVALFLALRGGAGNLLGLALLLLPAIYGSVTIMSALHRIRPRVGDPRVARLDAFVTPIRIRVQSDRHRWTVPGFLVGDHPLRVPEAAYRAMPRGTLCRLYLSPSGELLGVDPLIDPDGEELTVYPLVDKRPASSVTAAHRAAPTRATDTTPHSGARDDLHRPRLLARRRRGR